MQTFNDTIVAQFYISGEYWKSLEIRYTHKYCFAMMTKAERIFPHEGMYLADDTKLRRMVFVMTKQLGEITFRFDMKDII